MESGILLFAKNKTSAATLVLWDMIEDNGEYWVESHAIGKRMIGIIRMGVYYARSRW